MSEVLVGLTPIYLYQTKKFLSYCYHLNMHLLHATARTDAVDSRVTLHEITRLSKFTFLFNSIKLQVLDLIQKIT